MKNELGGSAIQQELKVWGLGGHNGMNRGTGGLNPQPPSIRTLGQSFGYDGCEFEIIYLPHTYILFQDFLE